MMRNGSKKLVAATLWQSLFINRNKKTYRKSLFYISHLIIWEAPNLLPLTYTRKKKTVLRRLWHNFYNSGLFLLDIYKRWNSGLWLKAQLPVHPQFNRNLKRIECYWLQKYFVDDPAISSLRKFQSDCMQQGRPFIYQPALFHNCIFVDAGSGNHQRRGIFFLFWTEAVRCAV